MARLAHLSTKFRKKYFLEREKFERDHYFQCTTVYYIVRFNIAANQRTDKGAMINNALQSIGLKFIPNKVTPPLFTLGRHPRPTIKDEEVKKMR